MTRPIRNAVAVLLFSTCFAFAFSLESMPADACCIECNCDCGLAYGRLVGTECERAYCNQAYLTGGCSCASLQCIPE